MSFLNRALVAALLLSSATQLTYASSCGECDGEKNSALESRGLFLSYDESLYRLEVVSFENNELTLSDGTVWHIDTLYSPSFEVGEKVTFRYKNEWFGPLWISHDEFFPAHVMELLGDLPEEYRTIEAFENDKKLMITSDGTTWSIPPTSDDFIFSNRSNVEKWNVGDRILISMNKGSLYDDFLLINLDIVKEDKESAGAKAFKE